MSQRSAVLDELGWRGLLHQYTDGAAESLAAGSVSAYCGFDPTASSLHVGHLIPVMGLMHLQRAGHRPIALVGGGTGMIGDPSFRDAERQLLAAEQVEANARSLRDQLERFLDFSGPSAARMRNNAEWLAPLPAIAFLRDVGKHFTVNYMMQKESVRSRLDRPDTGVSFTEFSYMLLQAYDFLELHRREGATLQVGGSDQWGNITAGVELIRRVTGAQAHAITFPLLTTAAGAKFGKSEGQNVWLDPARTTPYRFYQFWVQSDDRDAAKLLRYFTLLSQREIEAAEQQLAAHPERREAQQLLARDVTTRVHGADAARIAADVSATLFGGGEPSRLSAAALQALAAEVPSVTLSAPDNGGLDTLEVFAAAGLAASKGAARRLLEQGGLSVNGRRLQSEEKSLALDSLLGGNFLLLRKGARDWAVVRVTR